MSRMFILLLLAAPACAAPPPAPAVEAAPLGVLGFRVGTFLQIEGVREESGKVGSRTLRVDKVHGRTLEPPRDIWIDNLADGLPKGTRCVLRGYESARMIGLPDEVARAEHMMLHQAMWQMQRYFIITSVVEPAGMKIQ